VRGIIKKMYLINHCPTLTTHDSPFEVGVLKEEILVAEEKEIGGRQIPYIRRDVDDSAQLIPSLVNADA